MANTKLEAALTLAKNGFRVFPLIPNGKDPIKEMTQFYDKASTDETWIRYWWEGTQNFNIGISTDDYLVLDVDNKSKEKNGFETLKKLQAQGKILPPTIEQRTASGSAHLIYRTPSPVRNSVGKIGPGLDIRGFHGYIVAAGSIIDGKEYKIIYRPMNTTPSWLLQAAGAPRAEAPKAHIKLEGIDAEAAKARALKYLEALPIVSHGARNAGGFKVAAKLKDFGVDREETLILMMDFWKCEPSLDFQELAHVVQSAYKYGESEQGSESVEAIFQSPVEEKPKGEDPVAHLNKEFAFVRMKGAHRIVMETKDEDGNFVLDHLQEDTFHKLLAMRMFQSGEGNASPLTKHWMKAHNRRTYNGLVFCPGETVDPNFYNLWRGFSVEPLEEGEEITDTMKEGVKLFEEHLLFNICGGNVDYYGWVFGWFAHLVQKPWEKPETALVLKGRKGVGKNVLLDCVGSLFKHNYMVTAKKRHLIGNFNGHLENKILLVLDEALWGGNKEDDGILKALITEKKTEIERKGFESYSITSRLRVAILGNEDWLVPASDDERRYAVFNVGDDRMRDTEFFTAMMEAMEAGANRYLLTKLRAFDLSKINVRIAPDTEGLHEQKLNSLPPVLEWWYDVLFQGYVSGLQFHEEEEAWKTELDLTQLVDSASSYIKNTKGKSAYLNNDRLFKAVKSVVPSAELKRSGRNLVVAVPNLEQCREDWNKTRNMKIKWGI